MLFTAAVAVRQPITGFVLAYGLGWSLMDGRLFVSLALYVSIGIFWLPVLSFQTKMRDEACASALTGAPLTQRQFRLYRIWFACGIPAFLAIVALLWLTLLRPAILL